MSDNFDQEIGEVVFFFGEILSELDTSSIYENDSDYECIYYQDLTFDDSLVEPYALELDETIDIRSFDLSENTTKSIPEMVYM